MASTEQEDGSEDRPQVFMMPVHRDRWLGEFKRTVDQPLDLGPESERPDELKGLDETRIWGTRTGDRNESMWKQLRRGDIMLFYCNGWFFSAARIDRTIRSSDGGNYVWDNEESQLIYTVEDYELIAIPRLDVWDWFDYSENFTRRGLSRVYPERVELLRGEVGDIWGHIKKYSVNAGIEEILTGEVKIDRRQRRRARNAASTYFILKTGSGGYEDKPESKYHFKEGIPGSKQLREAEGDARFVYLEESEFYATGRIGSIRSEDRDGKTHYFAKIDDYSEIEPVSLGVVRDQIDPDFPIQYGIIEISKKDYGLIISTSESEYGALGKPDIRSDHPLVDAIETTDHAITAHRFTAPPEYWITAVATATISFDEGSIDRWEEIDTGDVILFYCQHSDLPEIDEMRNGFIGAGIVRGHAAKSSDAPWWWDEHNNEVSFPLLVAFERLYFTGDVESLVGPNPVDSQTQPAELEGAAEAITAGALPLDEAENLCETYSGRGLAISGTFSPFRRDGDPELVRPRLLLSAMAEQLSEVPSIDMYQQFNGQLEDDLFQGLHFPGELGSDLLAQINAALRAGKHIILTGPPGTGKTEIAKRTCKFLADEFPHLYSGYQVTTATADWSTFDTVGGYMPEVTSEDGGLSFSSGIVLNRLKSPLTGMQSNEPVVIDELNRADIDKSFGQLFTLLSGQSVQLPYTVDDREIELKNAVELRGLPDDNQYVVPESWRIFATMNTYDKTSLYEMSYAFMRRFAFIRVRAPEMPEDDQAVEDLMHEYVDVWGDIDWDRHIATEVGLVWRATNSAVEGRAIGPAIARDMLAYIMSHDTEDLGARLAEAVISFIYPQLEGVPKRKQILESIASVRRIDRQVLNDAARDMLQETIIESNE